MKRTKPDQSAACDLLVRICTTAIDTITAALDKQRSDLVDAARLKAEQEEAQCRDRLAQEEAARQAKENTRNRAQSMMAELEQMGFPVVVPVAPPPPRKKSPIVQVYNPIEEVEDDSPTGSEDDAPAHPLVRNIHFFCCFCELTFSNH